MSPFARRVVAAFGFAAVVFSAGIARASSAAPDSPRFHSPAQNSRLEPGLSLRVTWDRPVTRTGEGEMELLFSADGGRTFPLRLTRDLSLDTDQFVWRVPALPTSHARLALRAGDDGEPGEERIVCMSDEFSIDTVAAPDPEILFPSGDEWRTEEAERGQPPCPLSSSMDSASPETIRASPATAPAADHRPAPALPARSSSRSLFSRRLPAARILARDAPAEVSPAVALRL